jgi:hypothetical protein
MKQIEELDGEVDGYLNMSYDGNIRVSVSTEYDELLVYKDGQDEPEARFSLHDGSLVY